MVWDTYEISLWTHSDRFVSVLAQSGSHYHKEGYTPVLEMNTNGEVKLSFTIPIVVYNKETGELEDNSLWYDQLKKEKTLANEKKVKCILNKGKTNDKGEYTHTIVETVITNMTERRDGLQLFCDVECSGLAFKWLGKIGYTITLDSDTVLLEEEASGKVIHPNINYWLDKVFPRNPDGSWATKWGYEIRMNYAGMGQSRDATKVYENDSIVSWTQSISGVTPVYNETPIEKERFLSVSESNKYNITQDIAELFEVFVRYEFLYEDPKNPYKITRGIAVFYNELVDFTEYTISFKDNETGLSKTTNSNDIVTKLYVRDIESENSDDGYISISNALNNITKDNFILDFDYYKQSGQMSDEQIAAIPQFETDIRAINIELENNITERNQLENAILDKEVEVSNINDKIISAQANSNDYTDKMSLLDSSLSTNRLTDEKVAYFTAEKGNRVCVNFNRSGVISGTITCQSSGVTLGEPILDTYGFVTGIYLNGIAAKKIVYLTYDYDLLSFYRNNIETYDSITTSLNAKLKVVQAELGDKDHPAAGTLYAKLQAAEDKYEELRERKQKITLDFENLMGFFLKEGYWSTTDYKAPSEAKQVSGRITYDAEPYVGEQLSYYTVGAAETKTYYNFVEAETLKNLNIEDLTIVERWSNLGVDYSKQYLYNAQYTPQFMNINGGPHYVLLFNEDVSLAAGHKLYYTVAGSKEVEITSLYRSGAIVANQHNLMYRRYTIPGSENPITSTIEVYNGGVQLEEFYDYLIQNDGGDRVITFKCNAKIGPALSSFTVKYKCDRTTTQFFYDAQDVAKRSAFPVVSYEVSFSYLKNTLNIKPNVYARDMYLFIYTPDRLLYLNDPNDWLFLYESSYKDIAANLNDSISLGLGSIVRINDHQLGFHGVKGIVTKFTLHLDEPWNSQFVIQNYKTRFEDLFGRIVASSEQMKNNVISYGRAAEAVLPTGEFISEFLQNTIDNNRLIYNSGITSGVTLDEYGITVETTYPYNDGVTGMLLLRGGAILMSDSLYDDGERRWTTGITPSGINATAITVGRLDTEKINIYSGNQVRFTWQADGLHAFGQNPDGSTDFTTYVNYNQDGLQFRTNNFTAVNLGWDGLYLGAQDGAVELTANDGLCVYNAPQGTAGRAKLVQLGKISNGAVPLYGLKLFDYSGNETLVTDNTGKLWLRDTLIVGSTKNDMVGLSGLNDGDDPVRIWAGSSDKNKAPFRVYQSGSIYIGSKTSDQYVNDLAQKISDTLADTLKDRIDGKSTVFWGDVDRSNAQYSDLWYDVEHGLIYRFNGVTWDDITTDALKEALDKAGTAKAIADKKIQSYTSDTEPKDTEGERLTIGDLWINPSKNNEMRRWNGTAWVIVRDTYLDYLIDEVDGKTTVFYNSIDPMDDPSVKIKPVDRDLWYDTDGGAVKRREGDTWVDVTDEVLEKALTAAGTAQATADRKIQSFAQREAPEEEKDQLGFGDLWIDTDNDNTVWRWNGTTWVEHKDTHLDYLIDVIDNKITIFYNDVDPMTDSKVDPKPADNDIWYNTANGQVKRRKNGQWVDVSDTMLAQLLKDAATAQATADRKIQSFAQTEPPDAVANNLGYGDLWIDTNGNNALRRWNGVAWVEYKDTHLDYLIDRVDGKTTTFYSDVDPMTDESIKVKPVDKDLWYDIKSKTVKRRQNDTWVDVTDQTLAKALDAAGDARSIADKKVQTFAQIEPPDKIQDDLCIGDLWIDTDDNNCIHRWNGAGWERYEDTHLNERVSTVERSVDTINGTIKDFVSKDTFNDLEEKVKTNTTSIEQDGKRITEVANSVDAQGKELASVQLVLDGDEGSAGLIARMGNAESSIKTNAENIELKVTSSEVTEIVHNDEWIQGIETVVQNNNAAIQVNSKNIEACVTNDEMESYFTIEAGKITSRVAANEETLNSWDPWIRGIETVVLNHGTWIEQTDKRITMIAEGNITMAAGKYISIASGDFFLNSGGENKGFCVNTQGDPVLWIGDIEPTKAPFRVMNDGTVILTKLQRLVDETSGRTETIDLRSSLWQLNRTSRAVQTLSVSGDTLTISLYDGTSVNFSKPTGSLAANGSGMNNLSVGLYRDGNPSGTSIVDPLYIYLWLKDEPYDKNTVVYGGPSGSPLAQVNVGPVYEAGEKSVDGDSTTFDITNPAEGVAYFSGKLTNGKLISCRRDGWYVKATLDSEKQKSHDEGYNEGYSDGKADGRKEVVINSDGWEDLEVGSDNKSATVYVTLSNGNSYSHNYNVSGIYNAGASSVYFESVDLQYHGPDVVGFTVKLSNGKQTSRQW